MGDSDTTYPSKVDWWLGAILVLLQIYGLASLGYGIYGLATGLGGSAIAFLAAGLFVETLLALVVWPVRYTFTADGLHIQFGRFGFQHPYASLKGAKPSRNPLSAPALSLQRIAIRYEGRFGELLVSPVDRDGFLRELARRCPHLEYFEGEVIPAGDRPPDQSGSFELKDEAP